MCTTFGVDSSSRRQTHKETDRQTDVTERFTHAGGYTAGAGNEKQPWFHLRKYNSKLHNRKWQFLVTF